VTQRMPRSACTALLGALSLAALVACSSPDPVLYTIAPVAGTPRNSGPKVVLLERVDIARYLDRSQIVTSSENYRLDVKANDWWGEPLGAMLTRVLRQELGQRLTQSTVLNESGAVTASPDAIIELDLQRLDQDPGGNLILQAQASVNFKGSRTPLLRSFQLSVPSSAPGATGEVAAVSTAIGQLADGLAAMLGSG
jgi:uncharacterized lipoprotein YmbA